MQPVLTYDDLARIKQSAGMPRLISLLKAYQSHVPGSASILKQYRDLLLYEIAFPLNKKTSELAVSEMKRMTSFTTEKVDGSGFQFVQALSGSGLVYTDIVCSYSRAIVKWIAGKFSQCVQFSSADCTKETAANIMQLILPSAEYQQITQGGLNPKSRFSKLAGTGNPVALLAWLLQVFDESSLPENIKDDLYLQLKIFINWKPGGNLYSNGFLSMPVRKIFYQHSLIKKVNSKLIVSKKMEKSLHLSGTEKTLLTDIMRASLAVQYRETDPVSFADADELELFDMGRGLQVALVGMTKDKRLSLESYAGYMAFKNGLPLSYGGGWIWGQRCKIGVNIYPPFRKGESAWLFCQVLRLYFQHFGVRHFIVKPYQFGKGNPEGLKSGAFWFYYRLGFRPADPTIQQEAAMEWKKINADKKYRTSLKKLGHFTSSNMEWKPFGESFPGTDPGKISEEITEMINRDFNGSRKEATVASIKRLGKSIPGEQFRNKTDIDKQILANWALLSGLISNFSDWTPAQKKSFAKLIQLKQSGKEKNFIRFLQKQKRLWKNLDSL